MRDDLDVELVELYPERAPADLSALREKLFAEPEQRRDWRGAVAAAAVVLLLTGIAVYFRWPQEQPALSSGQSLTEAADRLRASAEPSGAYKHVTRRFWQARTVDVSATRWYAYTEEFLVELWIPAAPKQQVKESRRATGEVRWLGGTEPETVLANRPPPNVPGTSIGGCPATPCDVSTESAALPEDVEKDFLSQPHNAFERAWRDLVQPFTNNRAQAAVYDVLAQLPAVRYVGEWAYLDTVLEGGRLRLRIDQASGRFIGYERLSTSPSRLPPNTVLESLELTVESTDQAP